MTWHSTLCDLTKVKKQRVKGCQKRVQEVVEGRRKRNRSEDGRLMRRRWRKRGRGERRHGGGANKRILGLLKIN